MISRVFTPYGNTICGPVSPTWEAFPANFLTRLCYYDGDYMVGGNYSHDLTPLSVVTIRGDIQAALKRLHNP